MKILCLDQSTKFTGWCTMVNKKLKKSGVLAVENADRTPIMTRFRIMTGMIRDLMAKEKPDYVVFEGTQFQRNYDAFSQLSRLQGLIMGLLFQKNIGFVIVEPTRWKAHCGIKGKTREIQKPETQEFILNTYGKDVGEDEADAIGIGTWAIHTLKEENANAK